MSEQYDSTQDTLKHIAKVQSLILDYVIPELVHRAHLHDATKLLSPEKEMYDKYIPMLRASRFGSAEYSQILQEMGPGLEHHYEANRHHPEHFEFGIHNMTLIDLIEMVCDWIVASQKEGDPITTTNRLYYPGLGKRFEIDTQLMTVLYNTVQEMFNHD